MYDLERPAPPDVAEGDVVRYGSSASRPGTPRRGAGRRRVRGAGGDRLAGRPGPHAAGARGARAGRDAARRGRQRPVRGAGGRAGGPRRGVDPGAPGDRDGGRLDGDPPGLGGGAQRRDPAGGRAGGDPPGHERGARGRPRDGARDAPSRTRRWPWPGRSASCRTTCGGSRTRPDGAGDVDAIEGYALAFRRADYVARGPLDEHFVFYRNLDIWWSLVLRDQGDGRGRDDAPPRRAVRVAGGPVTRHAHRGWASLPDERARPAVEEELLPGPQAVRDAARPARRAAPGARAAAGARVGASANRPARPNERTIAVVIKAEASQTASFPRRCGTARPHFLPGVSG